MEATGDYWKGPFYRLEAEGFDCVLADAKQVKHLPGRPKHDPGDSRWLAACFERGAVTSCFVATAEFRVIRLHTRYRRGPTREGTPEEQRAAKIAEIAAGKASAPGRRPRPAGPAPTGAGAPPAATWPPGPAAPRWPTPPANAPDAPDPRRATGTWPASPARPPPRPARPRPAKAPATGGWPAAAARRKPRSRSATPS